MTEENIPVPLDTRRTDIEPVIEITKIGWCGYMWSIDIPGTLACLTKDAIYPTKKWALWSARRAWKKEQKQSKVEAYPLYPTKKGYRPYTALTLRMGARPSGRRRF